MSEKAKKALEYAEYMVEYQEDNRLYAYTPYPYQKRFHSGKDIKGSLARQRLLMAANKTGKTYCGAMEMAYHLTGRYPDWWTGAKFNRAVIAWAAGNTTGNTRGIVQTELLGEAGDEEQFGKGTIPKDLIVGTPQRLPGVPNAFQSVKIRHVSGKNSKLEFKSYEQGKMQWMGKAVDVTWLDEEPPQDIYSQALRASLKTGGLIYMTFTPESGMTDVVRQFMTKIKRGQALYHATWDDAPHLNKEIRAQVLEGIPEFEREMRSKGIPVLGSGMVFPVSEEDLKVEPFGIPEYWPRICGLDFGWDHPTAAVWLAWDRDTDTVYVYDCYRKSTETPIVHSAAIRERGKWIPVIWPHDGSQHDKGSGRSLAEIYRKQDLNMTHVHFKNSDGSIAVEPGIMDILQRMQTGRFKVFSYLRDWFEELRMYHRKDGKIIKVNDDLMSATRYASQSLQFASVGKNNKRVRRAITDYNYFEKQEQLYA
jgi:phage terminase large subunit-like protein